MGSAIRAIGAAIRLMGTFFRGIGTAICMTGGAMRGMRRVISPDGFCFLARWVRMRAKCPQFPRMMGAPISRLRVMVPLMAAGICGMTGAQAADARAYFADGRDIGG